MEAIHLILTRLYSRQSPEPPFPKQFLRQLMLLVLTDNIFSFDSKIYRQKTGIAMGTKCAPALANLFLVVIEDRLFNKRNHQAKPLPLLWRRYIDDVFGIWTEGQEALEEFKLSLNEAHHSLQFVLETDNDSIPFLDLVISKQEGFLATGTLDLDLYRKPCDTLAPLPFHSAHPRHIFKGIFIGQVKRLIRNTNDITRYHLALNNTISAFRQRGYPIKKTGTHQPHSTKDKPTYFQQPNTTPGRRTSHHCPLYSKGICHAP